jgi:hypothetical protein
VVPQDFHEFFSAAAAVSGALIGLLFVAVSVAPDRLVGRGAAVHVQSIAAGAFTAFINALFVSLGALLPDTNLGIPTTVTAVAALSTTAGLGALLWVSRRRELVSIRTLYLLVAAGLLYVAELLYAVRLVVTPDDRSAVQLLAYFTLGLFAIGLGRSWELLGARGRGVVDALWQWAEDRQRDRAAGREPDDRA